MVINLIDNGIGIALEERQILETMSRLYGREYEGAVSGFATSKWIVQNHQRTIGGENSDRNGGNFCFTEASARHKCRLK